jgi:hypothetical protein
MPRKCTICENESRHEIDVSLVSPNATLRDIARQYRVSKDALSRHIKGGHIAEKITKAKYAHEALAADNLLNRIQKFHTRFEKMAKNADSWGDPNLELRVYQTQAKYLELEGKATGAFREKMELSGNMNITGQIPDEEVERRAREIFAKRSK